MTDLPIKIDPCPIKEAVFELRFGSNIPEDAIFGIVFNQFKDDYNNTATPLPILEIPTIVRNQDPNLMFAAHYKMDSEFFTMQIGPRVISLANVKKYIGWEEFEAKIIDLYQRLQSIDVLTSLDRLALRYINIFPDINIFHKSSVSVTIDSKPLSAPSINLATQLENNSVTSGVRIISGAQAQLSDGIITGSIIDIDSSMQNVTSSNFKEYLNKVHDEEKRLFYQIVGSQHLSELNPEYE